MEHDKSWHHNRLTKGNYELALSALGFAHPEDEMRPQ